jgi:hypothetical protein
MRLGAELLVVALASTIVGALVDDRLIGASLPVIWGVWRFMRLEGGPPVLAFAFTFHWSQVVIGLYYFAATGRMPLAMTAERYPEMVLIGLGCVAVFIAGMRIGDEIMRRKFPEQPTREISISWTTLLVLYFAILTFRTALHDFAWQYPGLAQGLLAITYVRLALFYLILRRLVAAQRYQLAAGFAVAEVALGLTGFFAEFREPIFIAAVVLAEQFDYRRVQHWMALTAVGSAALLVGVLWIGIRSPLRQDVESRVRFTATERLNFSAALAQNWVSSDKDDKLESVDSLVDRLWDVYYPALALARVPEVLPHTDGTIMWAALQHVLTPRILVPDKADIESDSLQVRKYTGLWVAGPEQNTTISFGYPIQAYIDFGIPGLFVPVLLYAVFMGAAYRFFLRMIRHRELAVSVVTVIFWMSLYAFNRSWPKMIGLSLTLMVYLGGVTILADKYLLSKLQTIDAPSEGDDEPAAEPDPTASSA